MTGTPEPDWDALALAQLGDMRRLRRAIHASPECGLSLPATQRAILRELDGLPLEVHRGEALSSVTAVLRGTGYSSEHPGPVVLLRADMDALPIIERSGEGFAAENGAMHACGHDLHVAALVGAVRLLAAHRDALRGSIVCMFQPGEEGFGGGRLMIEEGVLDAAGASPVAAFALHVDSRTPFGVFVTRPGPIMAGVCALQVTVRGSGGHAAYPHLGADPVPVAAQLILAVQSFVARRIPAADPAVISIGRLSSDSAAGNVLASQVSFEANIRFFSPAVFALVRDELSALLSGVGGAHGCAVDIECIPSYPAAVNDPDETAFATELLARRFGPARLDELGAPAMASEDFSYVLERVPGALIFLGAADAGAPIDAAPPMHSELTRFDDVILVDQAAALASLAHERLLLA